MKVSREKSAIFMALILTACAAQHTVITNGVPNLRCVDPAKNIWRGGQPTASGWAHLGEIGISNVVKLNTEEEGMDLIGGYYDPITLTEQLFKVHDAPVDMAVAHIKPGTYIHCSHGQDRTGLIVAVYRVRVDGWTKTKAEQEMISCGFHKELHGLWDWWEDWKP